MRNQAFLIYSLEQGTNARTIWETLGHHATAFTLDVYGDNTKRMRREGVDKIDGLMTGLLQKDSGHE